MSNSLYACENKHEYRVRSYDLIPYIPEKHTIFVIFDSNERLESSFIKDKYPLNSTIINIEKFTKDWQNIELSNKQDKRLNVNLRGDYLTLLRQLQLLDAINVLRDRKTRIVVNLDFVGFTCTSIINAVIETCQDIRPDFLLFNIQHHFQGIRLSEPKRDKRAVKALQAFTDKFDKSNKLAVMDFEETLYCKLLNKTGYDCLDTFDSTTKQNNMKAYVFGKAG